MPACSEMKVGDILECSDCGLQLRVVSTCKDCSTSEGSCCAEDCVFTCCDKEMTLKPSATAASSKS